MADPPVREASDRDDGFDGRVRRVDPDRWLSSRFIRDPQARVVVVAIYALDEELSRIAPGVTQPLAGEIRLAWWRERIEEIAGGGPPPNQPLLRTLAPSIAAGVLPLPLFDALVEARHAELDTTPTPFEDDAALARYLDGTSGAVMGLAVRALDADTPLRAVVEAGRAWGLARLSQAHAVWRARGRAWTPRTWPEESGRDQAARLAAEVEQAMARARIELKGFPVGAFPAVAHATLSPAYARGRTMGELERRARLLRAVLTGRI